MKHDDPFDELLRTLEDRLGRGSDVTPPDDAPQQPDEPRPTSRRWLWSLLAVILFLLGGRVIGFLADWAWFSSVDYASVFWTRYLWQFAFFAAGSLLFYLFYAANVILARRIESWALVGTPLQQVMASFGLRVTPVVMIAGLGVALLLGLSAANAWQTFLLYMNRSTFGVEDPLFRQDIGFYFFTLPVLEFVRSWLLVALGATFIAVLTVSGAGWRGWQMKRGTLIHLAVLAGLILLLFAWQYRLNSFELLYSERGSVFGATYTDVNAQLPAYNLLIVVSIVAAVVLVAVAVLGRGWRAIAAVVVVWVGVAFVAGAIYPALVQRFRVGPNELNLEAPYIAENIRFTRLGFDLTDVQVRDYDARQELTVDGLLQAEDTLRNIRLWDYRPLLRTYNQVQALRQYYEFNDVDIDRYVIDGKRTQVMLGVRELLTERLNPEARTWVNERLVYTHGFGVAASPVSQVTPDGLPLFYLQDLPPTGVITITQPQIYFGERTASYVIGRTNMSEFDYPNEDGNVTTRFAADAGIPMSWWNRLLFAVHLADINLLLNRDTSADSRLLWRREIVERIGRVAPFLTFDGDPYIVVGDDGRLVWMLDAFTTSGRLPYSAPLNGVNYIRNAVKVTTSAYDGRMTFYVANEEPLIEAYGRIFPNLFQPLSAMPADLQDNIRFPHDLLTAQAEVYRIYHMTDPVEFYNQEDVWAWPEEIFENESVRVDPYPVLMQLPAEPDLDYVQILPFTPLNRENMVAWLAVQNDPEKYGQKIVYTFGKDALSFGPKQIEARIDQDPAISAQLTLWNQQGSGVIRGNLLVFPIGGSLLYVEPLYLQSIAGKIPELKRVIAATADEVVMAENLGLALVRLFGNDLLQSEALGELGARTLAPDEIVATNAPEQPAVGDADAPFEDLVRAANDRYARAQASLRAGDWAGYGAEIAALGEVLEQLTTLSGIQPVPPPQPTPTAPLTPTPSP